MENIQQSTQKEIFILILADMRNRKLISGLEAAGLVSEDFYTDLITLILSRMGFLDPADEELNDWYENTIEHIIEKDLSYFKSKQRDMASRMYDLLILKKHALYQLGIKERKNRFSKLLIYIVKHL